VLLELDGRLAVDAGCLGETEAVEGWAARLLLHGGVLLWFCIGRHPCFRVQNGRHPIGWVGPFVEPVAGWIRTSISRIMDGIPRPEQGRGPQAPALFADVEMLWE
jgi:hypothetical protein